MRISKLRRWARIEIDLNPTTSQTGEVTHDWQMFYEGPCRFEEISPGSDKYSSDQPFSEQFFNVVMRWVPKLENLSTKMFLYDCRNRKTVVRKFEIVGHSNHYDRNKEVHIHCRLIDL